jgi:hypothetical protein
LALALVLVPACGEVASSTTATPSPSSVPALQAVAASTQVVLGRDQRVAFGILNTNGVPVPDAAVTLQVFLLPPGATNQQGKPLGPPQPAPYEGALLQGKGVYVIHQTFYYPGFYSATVQARKDSVSTTTTAAFQVLESDPTPAVGTPAPPSRNPTKDQVTDISTIDTGVPPDDMHYISVADAIAAHHPVVVYFGSPGFCRSKTCGPEADVVKALEAKYRIHGIDFAHIETYKGGRPDNTDTTKATTSPWFDEWHLTSDPWVFVVDASGNVAAKFDGPTAPREIDPALAAVAPR